MLDWPCISTLESPYILEMKAESKIKTSSKNKTNELLRETIFNRWIEKLANEADKKHIIWFA